MGTTGKQSINNNKNSGDLKNGGIISNGSGPESFIDKNNRQNQANDIPNEIQDNIDWFRKKQRKGTIDVWWLYDDGGKNRNSEFRIGFFKAQTLKDMNQIFRNLN